MQKKVGVFFFSAMSTFATCFFTSKTFAKFSLHHTCASPRGLIHNLFFNGAHQTDSLNRTERTFPKQSVKLTDFSHIILDREEHTPKTSAAAALFGKLARDLTEEL